jgi:hypothetical protein
MAILYAAGVSLLRDYSFFSDAGSGSSPRRILPSRSGSFRAISVISVEQVPAAILK